MIRHVVFVRFRADVPADESAAILAHLRQLAPLVPGMSGFAAGPNLNPEGLDQGYTHAFCCDFTDAAARDAYLAHPAHQAAAARLVAALEGGVAGLAVLDFALG